MYFGATMYFADYSMSPGELALAQRGFESLWASEHSHLRAAASASSGKRRRYVWPDANLDSGASHA
jgi:hypothetical protein